MSRDGVRMLYRAQHPAPPNIFTPLAATTGMVVCVFVNGQRFEVEESVTVGDLIGLGGGNPGEYELQKRAGATGPVEQVYGDPAQMINLAPPAQPEGEQAASVTSASEQGGRDEGPVARVDECEHFTTRFKGTINPA